MKTAFKTRAGACAPITTDFEVCLERTFNRDTVMQVRKVFKKLKLPLPQGQNEFMDATQGVLLFLNKYGLVIRIENTVSNKNGFGADRINNSPWILQPLSTVNVGEAIIEICPGCHIAKEEGDKNFLKEILRQQNINYWDAQICNGGRLPIRMPRFPEGVPVVIDRLAAEILSHEAEGTRKALQRVCAKTVEADNAQKKLYGPLRTLFRECWNGSKEMKEFWGACVAHKQQGKLVAAWMDTTDTYEETKTGEAKETGAQYAQRFEKRRKNQRYTVREALI